MAPLVKLPQRDTFMKFFPKIIIFLGEMRYVTLCTLKNAFRKLNLTTEILERTLFRVKKNFTLAI